MFDLAFELKHNEEDWEAVPESHFHLAIFRRLLSIMESGEVLEAVGECDSYTENEEYQLPVVTEKDVKGIQLLKKMLEKFEKPSESS